MTRLRAVIATTTTAILAATATWTATNSRADASGVVLERVSTTNPYTLAVDLARQIAGGDLTSLTHLIITTGEQPFDAIISAGLAGYLDTCPQPGGQPCNRTATLLTQPDNLPQSTVDAITETGVPASRITIIGGTNAVSTEVQRQLATTAGWNGEGANPITRVAGATRYDTATALATHITTLAQQPGATPLPASYRTIIIANGHHPADALAASTLAYRGRHLLLLAPNNTPDTAALAAATRTLDANCALIIGGTNALPGHLDTRLADTLTTSGAGTCTPQRIAGTDRHHTATLIATRLTTYNTPTTTLIANPHTQPLPLTAAPLTRTNTTLLYTTTNQLPPTTTNWLTQHPTINTITLIGTTTTITPRVATRAFDITNTPPPPVVGGGGGAGGSGGGGGGLDLAYTTTQFDSAQTSQLLHPSLTGGTGPFSYAITNGNLPPGVTFDTTTGTFTGPSTWNLGFVTISAGYRYSCGILTDTTARCWGAGGDRQLGDGTTAQRPNPVAVLASGTQASNPVTLSGVTQITVGLSHSCAVLVDTTARCWGLNANGSLGIGTTAFTWFENPVAVLASGTQANNPVTLSGVTRISVGKYHTCALLLDTTARCWGANYQGQLGDGTWNNEQPNPVAVLASGTQVSNPVTLSGITQIETGSVYSTNNHEHTCAAMADTTMRCWGRNANGQLGDGDTIQQLNPVAVLASGTQDASPVTLSGVTQISVGYQYACALMVDTTARCWGSGSSGKLGDGTTIQRLNPVAVLASGTQDASPVTLSGITRIATSLQHTCAVLAGGGAHCWGSNGNGRLGDGTSIQRLNPVAVLASGTEAGTPEPQTGVVDIAGGEGHTCATLAAGGARCWGFSWNGELGDGTDFTTRLNPVRVLASGTEASSPVVFGGAITLAPTELTVTVTDTSNGATASRVITLTSS
jgi:alpha-tubulin suppressor-like RCC1 family protein/putative cell wall-binding protein